MLTSPAPCLASAPPWQALTRHATQDVDEQAALLHDWQQDYAQASPGAFSGWIDELRLGGMRLFVEHTSRRLLQRGALRPGHLALGLPLALGEGPISFCGATDWQEPPLRSARLCSFSGTQGFEFATPEGLVMAGIELPLALLTELAQAEEHAALARLAQRAGLHAVAPEVLAALRQWLQGAFTLMRAQPDCLADPLARQALQRMLLSNLLELLPLDAGSRQSVNPLPQWTLVERAQRYVRADPQTPHTVADLCLHLRVSRRTLQAAFQKALGLCPATWLRTQRLAGAHRSLREARSVAEAATQWGFWHLGLFARDYKRQFGRLPSQDLRRSAAQATQH